MEALRHPFCLCIHGHYYQPPRENPWIEDIERQDSAWPFHDWNERIHFECYLPNSKARIFDDKGHIADIVNNFETTSFNFGPTLLGWLKNKHQDTYLRVIEADRKSLKAHGGHGNAIAQSYGHMILPLAKRRDKVTQVRWGIEDFRHHFGRSPEGMWIPETACDDETLEVLAEEGIRFTILAPSQAEAVRPIGSEHWQDVSQGSIDPKRPYRYFSAADPSRFVDIFFYDGPVSRAVGFEDLLSDAKRFMDRLSGSASNDRHEPQLIHIATDGETYGHHKPFGDRVLAYLTHWEAPARGFRMVNYGEFLAECPPRFEARIKKGENGEGTSWSCVHGVRRWRDDCGCHTGGPAGWHQKWRAPLRESLDWLREELDLIFEVYGRPIFRNVWEARNEYIRVLLDRKSHLEPFLAQHLTTPGDSKARNTALRLLEMQRHGMLMYTSCGWFFNDISGIETVQILQYADRAMRLAFEISGRRLESDFLDRLEKAPGNVEAFLNGRKVFLDLVRPSVATLEHVVSYYAIGSMFESYYPDQKTLQLYCFDIEILYRRTDSFGSMTLNFGRLKASSRVTLTQEDYMFAAIQIGPYDFRASVKRYPGEDEFQKIESELFESLHQNPIFEFVQKIDSLFDSVHFGLKDLLREDRLNIIRSLTQETLNRASEVYERLYDENLRMNQIYRSINLPIPSEFRYAVEYTLNKRMKGALEALASQGFYTKKSNLVLKTLETAHALNVEIRKPEIARYLSRELGVRVRDLARNPSKELVAESLNICRLAKKLGVEVDEGRSQEELFMLFKRWQEMPSEIPKDWTEFEPQMIQLMSELHISVSGLKKVSEARA